jgi:hypothetical protein
MDSNFQYASTEHRISRWVDRIAAGLTKARCASEHGLAMGGGRLAERRFTRYRDRAGGFAIDR